MAWKRASGSASCAAAQAAFSACASSQAATISGSASGTTATDTIIAAASAPAEKIAVATEREWVKRAAWAVPRGELRGVWGEGWVGRARGRAGAGRAM